MLVLLVTQFKCVICDFSGECPDKNGFGSVHPKEHNFLIMWFVSWKKLQHQIDSKWKKLQNEVFLKYLQIDIADWLPIADVGGEKHE